jgi:tetratricopeptide (TPR) repeat protein
MKRPTWWSARRARARWPETWWPSRLSLIVRFIPLVLLVTVGLERPAMAQAAYALPGALGFEYQRLNNCGPVTAKMVLSLYGIRVTQAQAAAALKGGPRDRNVGTNELAAYLERNGLRTVRRWLLTPDLARRLVRAGFPVIANQTETPRDDIGHFRVVHAFDATGLRTGDSMLGPRFRLSDADFQRVARPYNGEFLIAYRPAQQPQLERALGPDWSRKGNLERLAAHTQKRLKTSPNDAFALWGLGQARLYLGASRGAADAFDRALRAGLPPKHFWYQHDAFEAWNRIAAYATTRRVAAAALKQYPTSTEINLAYATALEGLGRPLEASRARRAAALEDPRVSARPRSARTARSKP